METGCRIETIESPTDPAKTLLAIYENGDVRLGERFELNGRLFVPKKRDVGIFSRVRLPKGVAPYGEVRSFVTSTRSLLFACVDIDPIRAKLVSFFVMSSWFPEKLPVAPYLALVGMPRSGKTTITPIIGDALPAQHPCDGYQPGCVLSSLRTSDTDDADRRNEYRLRSEKAISHSAERLNAWNSGLAKELVI